MVTSPMVDLSPAEREALHAARLAVFEDRIIFEAQPPVDDATLAEIARRCAGPLPDDLVALWKTSFGGSLAYDLRVAFGEHIKPFSFTELFFPGSGGYHDLWGWIEHEEALAEEVAEDEGREWSGRLPGLPFGGFEYLERVVAIVQPGQHHGAVLAWSQGLPPAWTMSLHEDAVAIVAPTVRTLFRQLVLEADPTIAEVETTASPVMEAIASVSNLGAGGRSAAERLRGLVRSVVLDWRAAVASGTIAAQATLRQLALEHAVHVDDLELLRRLDALGCSLVEPLSGGASGLAHAFSHGSLRAARFLMDRSVPVQGALRAGAHVIDVDLARELLARGDISDEHAVFAAIDAGHVDTGMALLDALPKGGSSLQLAIRARDRAAAADALARRIERGEMKSNVSADTRRAQAARLRDLADRVDPTTRR